MEYLDIYDASGNPTGKTAARGSKLEPGCCFLATHIWLRNSKGEWLIQQRAATRDFCPGMWAVTGGMVSAGESGREAAVREAKEEVGVSLQPQDLSFIGRFRWMEWYADVWVAETDVPADMLILQKEEVSAARWAASKEIVLMIERGEFIGYSYLSSLFGPV